jgi:hypothetical protein
MKFTSSLIWLLPYVLIALTIIMIKSIISAMKKKEKFKIDIIIEGIVVGIILAVYYLPVNNILKDPALSSAQVINPNKKDFISITDKEKSDKLLSIINSHTFIRSAKRTILQQNFEDSEEIIIRISMEKPTQTIYLYIYKDNLKNNFLKINNQAYNVKDKAGFSKDIFEALEQFGVLTD